MQTQKAQQKSGKPPKGGVAKVIQPHTHGSGFYRGSVHSHRRDKYEYQADEAARRIMHGEKGVARMLTPTSAASFRISASAGQPIPHDIRTELEDGFGADLSAVRLHQDVAAHAGANAENSEAFTSGSHIYFSENSCNPSSSQDFTLIVHEVSHVLQQTGRKNSYGVLSATDLIGSGNIQRDWDFNQFRDNYRARIGTRIGAEVSDQESFERVENAIREVIGLQFRLTKEQGQSTEAGELETKVTDGQYDNEILAAKSLLFDVLKIWQRYAGASHLIDTDSDISTRYYPNDEFLDHFRDAEDYGIESIRSLMESEHTTFRNVWPYNLTSHLWNFLIQSEYPLREATTGYPESEESIWQEYRNRGETFIPNERFLLAREMMYQSDQLRLTQANDAIDAYLENPERWPLKFYAHRMASELGNPVAGENVITRRARIAMRNIARNADQFWDRVIRLETEIRDLTSSRARELLLNRRSVDQLNTPPDREIPEDDLLNEFFSLIEHHTQQLFYQQTTSASPEEEQGEATSSEATWPTVLSHVDYTIAIAEALANMDGWQDRFSDHLGEVYVYRRREESEVASLAQWLGWSHLWYIIFMLVLRDYDASSAGEDDRRRHRIVLAKVLYQMGLVTGNNFITETAEAVFQATDVRHSYVLLTNDWRDTSHEINHLTRDFTARLMIRSWGITVEQLVIFYHILYQADMADRLIQTFHESPEQEAEDEEHQRFVAHLREQYNTALDPARTRALFPTRYDNHGAIINYFAGDRYTLSEILLSRTESGGRRYPEVTRFASNYADGELLRVLMPINRRPPNVFLWVLPPLDDLVGVLRGIDLLNNLVVSGVTNSALWLSELGSHIAQFSREDRAALSREIREESAGFATTSMSWRRRHITEEIRSRLHVATTHRGDIDHYTDMTQALAVMREFSFHIRPVDTTEPQMTAMMLDLGNELNDALLDEPSWLENLLGIGTRVDTRYDVITGYYGMIDQALDYLKRDDEHVGLNNVIVVNVQRQEGEAEDVFQAREQRAKESRATELLEREAVLLGIKQQLSAAIVAIQREGVGFEARQGQGVRSFMFGQTLPLQQEMRYNGKTYLIDEIFTNFNFFPAYAPETDAGHSSILLDASGDEPTRMGRSSTQLLRYTEDNVEHVVTASEEDDQHLALLAMVIEEAAFAQSMENLAETIEGAAELTMDLIELIPGFGQGFMIARMGVEIARFVIEELPDIREAFNNPKQMFNDLVGWFDQKNMIENMLKYVMFEADSITLPISLTSNTEDTNHTRRRRHGSMDRLIHAMKTLGEKILYAIQLLQRRVRGGMVRAQLRLVEHRTLMRILEYLPGLALTAVDLAAMARSRVDQADLDLSPTELLGNLMGEGSNIQAQIQETFGEIVQGLHNLELPDTIVPMESVVDIVLGYALDRFGRKGRVINDLLQALGARQALADTISEHLVEGTNIDINTHWRDSFRIPLQRELISLQNYIINQALNPLIEDTLGRTYMINIATLGEPTIATASGEEAETQPYLRENSNNDKDVFRLPTSSRGVPLHGQRRETLENQFGHDLGHVRVHRDEDSDQLNKSADSYALTSGSHVFMSSDVELNSHKGQHILRHEIAHILQQTGDRPLSEDNDSRPVLGRPGRGLRRETEREMAADRMAQLAEQRPGRVHIEEEGGEGLYPTPRRFALRMLNYLSDPQLSEQVTEDMEDRIPRMSGEERRSFNTAKSEAGSLWRAVNQKVATGTTGIEFDAPFESGRSLIAAALRTVYDNNAQAIDAITYRSVRQLPNGQYRLREDAFFNQLEIYIYGRTGIVLTIRESGGRVGRIHVTNIHLGNAETSYSIWTNEANGVKRNTERAFTTHQDVLSRNWPRIREYIRNLQYRSSRVWDNRYFRLDEAFVTEVANHFSEVAEDEVELGNWEDYTTPTFSSSDRNVGLHVGTHGQLTANVHRTRPPDTPEEVLAQIRSGRASEYADFNISQAILPVTKEGRESHHIPQYLLVEYFRNDASTDLFPDRSRWLPGFDRRTGRLSSFNGGIGKQIDLHGLDPGGTTTRGLNLPAVSIAVRTHRRGQLHINQAFDWSPEKEKNGTRTQSAWMDYYFYNRLENESRSEGVSATTNKNNIVDRVMGMPAVAAKSAIYNAIKQTYSRVYDNMMDVLPTALENHEIPYYRDIALIHSSETVSNGQLRREYTPDDAQFSKTVNALEALNRRIMWQWR